MVTLFTIGVLAFTALTREFQLHAIIQDTVCRCIRQDFIDEFVFRHSFIFSFFVLLRRLISLYVFMVPCNTFFVCRSEGWIVERNSFVVLCAIAMEVSQIIISLVAGLISFAVDAEADFDIGDSPKRKLGFDFFPFLFLFFFLFFLICFLPLFLFFLILLFL